MEQPPFQFGLRAVFAATAGAAVLMAMFHFVPLAALGRLLFTVVMALCFSASVFLLFVVWGRFCLWIIERRRPFQFRLNAIFAVTTAVAALLAFWVATPNLFLSLACILGPFAIAAVLVLVFRATR